MLLAVTPDLPPPSGPPQAAPVAEPPSAVTQAVPTPVTPYAVPPAATAGRVNSLAIAALCCGLAAFVPLVGVLAVVFGAVALNQLRSGFQRGRGRAIAGIVLGAVGTVGWAALVVIGIATGGADPARDTAGKLAPAQTVSVQDLKAGDCFDGLPADPNAAVDQVTTAACTTPHEAQIAAVVELAAGSFPGDAKAADLADQACGHAVDPVVRDDAPGLDLSYVYPNDSLTWRLDRHATCILAFTSGKHAGSVLR